MQNNKTYKIIDDLKTDFSFILIELDNFSEIKESCGLFIQKIIQALRDTIQVNIRKTDVFLDHGCAFCLIVPNTNQYQAKIMMERIQKKISLIQFSEDALKLFILTISCSIIERQMTNNPEDCLTQAEFLLKLTKKRGINQIICGSNRERISLTNYEKLDYLQKDPLTGLWLRSVFFKNIDQCLQREPAQIAAVLVINLHRFRRVNNALGYAAGDNLLKIVAERLDSSVRKLDQGAITVTRLGGDEFAVFIYDLSKTYMMQQITDRLLQKIEAPYHMKGHDFLLSAHIGMSFYPQDGRTADQLIKKAEIARSIAKKSIMHPVCRYQQIYSQYSEEAFCFENALFEAVEKDQFFIEYQPVVHLKQNKIIAFEALVRWNHPTLGVIQPDHFIGLAERSGKIMEIGLWVIDRVFKDFKAWSQGDEIKIFVNVSVLQLSEAFYEHVKKRLEAWDLSPACLVLELTERITIDIAAVVSVLEKFNQLGVKIAIDDFGVGATTLYYLKRFPVSIIKIDKTLIHQLSTNIDKAIVSAIISIARSMNIDIIAEGVEDQTQMMILDSLGCYLMQGFFFSPAVSCGGVSTLLLDPQLCFQNIIVMGEFSKTKPCFLSFPKDDLSL